MKRIYIALMLVCVAISAQAQPQPTNLIPAPAAYSVFSGSLSSKDMSSLREKVRISEKALLRRLAGWKLADWQLKSAYWIEIGKKGVKIEAADEEGVFYARQTLKMMACLDSSLTCCTILDWPRFRYRGVMLDESRHFQGKDFVMKQLEMMLYPRVFAIAETGWSQAEKKNWPDFKRRASVLAKVARGWGYTVF